MILESQATGGENLLLEGFEIATGSCLRPKLSAHIFRAGIIFANWLSGRASLLRVPELRFGHLLCRTYRRLRNDLIRGFDSTARGHRDRRRMPRSGSSDSVRVDLADNGLKLCQPVKQLMVPICAWASVLLARRKDALEAAPEAVWTWIRLGTFDLPLATVDTAQGVDLFASFRALSGGRGCAHLKLRGLQAQ